MELIDIEYTAHPFYGSRRMVECLKKHGHNVNRKRISRLMHTMGIEAIYPKPNLSKSSLEHKKYPYLLRGVKIMAPNEVWSTDITYIPVQGGFFYLTAIIDWYTRYILAWKLSNTLDVGFCLEALREALNKGTPKIFNSDQGVQYTCGEFVDVLDSKGITISMDGKGRAFDNIFIERLWRTIKYEEVCIKRYLDGREAQQGLQKYISFYNNERPHQSLEYQTPQAVYCNGRNGILKT